MVFENATDLSPSMLTKLVAGLGLKDTLLAFARCTPLVQSSVLSDERFSRQYSIFSRDYSTNPYRCQARYAIMRGVTSFDFTNAARGFGIELSTTQLGAFENYFAKLGAWNARINLTAIIARDDVYLKHFLDSLSLAPIVRAQNGDSLIDIGSGAGFPGLPLKIIFPQLRVTLLEATGKKVAFLNHLITTLDLRDTNAIHARAEELARRATHREMFSIAVARAVADLATLCEYALPFVRVGGIFVAQKGIAIDAELRGAAYALQELGGRVRETVTIELPGLELRHLIAIEKIAPTPIQYPRRVGIPAKNPLR